MLFVFHGLPASGKSTKAKEMLQENPNAVQVERDLIRQELFGDDYFQNKEDEKRVTEVANQRIKEALKNNKDVILSDTSLNARFLHEVFALSDDIKQIYFDVPLEVCLERNKKRERQVPENVIYKMAKKAYDEKGHIKEFVYDRDKNKVFAMPFDETIEEKGKDIVLVDLDKTLALTDDLLVKQKKWQEFFKSIKSAPFNESLVEILKEDVKKEYTLWIMSGRPKNNIKYIQSFLDRVNLPFDKIILKRDQDFRRSYLYKQEKIEEILKNNNIIKIYDDDPKTRKVAEEMNVVAIDPEDV